jgi:ribonuclease-3
MGIAMFGLGRHPHRALERKLGYAFRNRKLLETALVHPSFRFETPGAGGDNQRMEFLGDAVLGMVAAAHIYLKFKDRDEGILTALRSHITSGKALHRIARAIDLSSELRIGRGEEKSGGRQRASTLADALEAVVGAAYLDGGFRAAEKIFHKLFVPELESCGRDQWWENPKGKLQDLSQRRWNSEPRYRVVSESGPVHAKTYSVDVIIGGHPVGHGTGTKKREAESQAAADALRRLGVGAAFQAPGTGRSLPHA